MNYTLVTGASNGIGRELALCAARSGRPLILVARSGDALESVRRECLQLGAPAAEVFIADLAHPNEVATLTKAIADRAYTVAELVNNAGLGVEGSFASETPWDSESASIEVNVHALTALSKALVPAMIALRRGRVLNIASTAAYMPGPFMAVYFATKAYVRSLSLALAEELRGTGVTVTSYAPGPTRSGFQRAAGMGVLSNKFPDAASVAKRAYSAMQEGEIEVVDGFWNRLQVFGVWLIPDRVVLRLVRRWMGR
jgi:short-subunit dehydrogenase